MVKKTAQADTIQEKATSLFTLSAYDYALPEELIAQQPLKRREDSALLVFNRDSSEIRHRSFTALASLLRAGDILVVNDTKVFPARLLGRKQTGGKVEALLLSYPVEDFSSQEGVAHTTAMLKASRQPKPGSLISIGADFEIRVLESLEGGKARIELRFQGSLEALLTRHGHIPLPPYIQRQDNEFDRERYQTRYASSFGAVAAPTAGLHFSDELLADMRGLGVKTAQITLHVGYGTFAPVRVEDIRQHCIHEEYVEINEASAERINECRAAGGRVWAVGTTTVRSLEFSADKHGKVRAIQGNCGLFIYPGYRFRVVDNIVTNFHLPRSSLLFLVSALAGRENILRCYQEAVAQRYRFFSYGDAMAIITRA